ncbi:ABC transporter permease [Croceitalea sp. MTPC5]|uniref:ABC transporter permease n=1 Tax=Croceitalea sp. MTPC5 TaxID=3056565 RepID=UPI002B3ADFE3|nr:ABC transporter permease [Croceitalea sp. MTPC5]
MFKNHLKVAWRSIKKEKLLTVIKVGGFALGIAACLLIALFIKDELSYDKHYKNADNIYRVVLEVEIEGETKKSTHFPLLFAETLKTDFPEVQNAGKVYGSQLSSGGKRAFRKSGDSQNIFEEGFLIGDQGIFEILDIPLIQGSESEVLLSPRNIVISESKADKYFPNGDALGKNLILDDNSSNPYTIAGVMEDFPTNSHLNFDFILPIDDSNISWTSTNYFTYLSLDDNSSVTQLQTKMQSILEKYVIPAQIQRGRDASFIEVLKTIEYKLQPISDIHLKSDIEMQDGLKHGDLRFVWLFAAVAVFILLLACINFINLSTAKSANRAKEVGLRKTIGAFKSNLISQFLTESVLFSVISFMFGILLAWGLLPAFNSIAAKNLEIPWADWWFFPTVLICSLTIGLIAGLYPAFYLSAFRPASVLKGSPSTSGKSGKFRSGLVVFQFTTSVILIIGTIVIFNQMDFILNKELGYDKDQVIILESTSILGNKIDNFKQQLLQLPQVEAVSKSDFLPVDGSRRNQTTFKNIGEGSENEGVLSQTWEVDYDYVNTLGMTIVEGRNFSKEFAMDSVNSVIVNQKMVNDLGLANPLGKEIDNNYQQYTIVGVIEDFHFKSLKEDITPLAISIGNSPNTLAIKIRTEDMNGVLSSITAIWDRNVPNQSISYGFLNQKFAQMHEDVQRMGSIFNSFSLFAIIVACLGLFALSAFMVEQRKKEISIRIVLGAPFRSIYRLLTWDFLKLVLVSIAIAVPLGWYMMNRWLEDFAYRINIGWEVFAGAALAALIIAVLTISYQSIGAALIQPLKSLRKE